MKREKMVILCILVFIILLIYIFLGGRFEEYIDKKQQNMTALNDSFVDVLYLKGEFVVGYNRVEISDFSSKTSNIMIDISFYNYFNNDDLTCGELLDEYKLFCQGKKENKYKNLKKYSEFIQNSEMLYVRGVVSDNLPIKHYREICDNYIRFMYPNSKIEELTEEELLGVCNSVLKHSDKWYRRYLTKHIEYTSIAGYYKLYDEEFEEDIDTNSETGELFVERDNVTYYLREEVVNWVSEEKSNVVYKIEISGPTEDAIFAHVNLGDEKDVVVHNFQHYGLFDIYEFQLVSESDEKVVYVRDGFSITVEFNDGQCSKMILEVVE